MVSQTDSVTATSIQRRPWVRVSNPPAGRPDVIAGPRENALPFKMGLALVFLRFSMLHQVLYLLMGLNLRLLYLVGIPALLGVVLAGGIPRTLRDRSAAYWVAFAACLIVSTPFSSWRG